MNSLEQIMPLTWWGILMVGLINIIAIVMILHLVRKVKKFQSAYLALQSCVNGNSLDALLESNLTEIRTMSQKLGQSDKRLEQIEKKLRASVDRAELVRFNAFDNMGSDLSFALAFINQDGNGVVLSSINSREESRVYAKPVIAGESTYHLSDEEKKVITRATQTIKV